MPLVDTWDQANDKQKKQYKVAHDEVCGKQTHFYSFTYKFSQWLRECVPSKLDNKGE